MRTERRALLLGLLLALLLARALRALLSSVFYESLATLRLNGSATWTLVLLAPLLAPALGGRRLPLVIGVAGAASALLPLARFTEAWIPLAALATGAGLLGLASLWSREGMMAGALVGLAADGALLMLGHSHDPTLARWSVPLALLLAGAAAWLATGAPAAAVATGARGWPRAALAGAALGALFAAQLAYLASPYAAARWLHAPPWAAGLCGLGGLAVGATLVRRAGWALWVLAALALIDVALVLTPLPVLSLALLQVALGAAAVQLAGRAEPISFGVVLAALLFVLLFFRDPLGLPEWRAVLPALALLALAPVLRARPEPRGRAGPLPALAIVALVLLSAAPPHVPDAPEGRELTIVTWNVHQAFGDRGALDPEIYAEVLRSLDADVVLLQESDTARLSSGGIDIVRYLAAELGMHAARGRAGPALLSRYPFVQPAEQTEDWSLESAIAIDGAQVAVQSVHFGRSPSIRVTQAQALLAEPEGARIVAGDFNLFSGLVDEGPYGTLTARYEDAWVASGHARDDPAGNTFRLPALGRRIDLVLVDGLEVVSADRLLDERTRLASDHLPVVARLRLSTA